MVIDLTKVAIGMEMSPIEEMKLKSSCLLKELHNVTENYNYIIVPIAIYNMIENHDMFKGELKTIYDNGLYFVGNWYHFKVHVDMLMQSNQILMMYDKQTTRDIKIDKILNNIKVNEELIIEVKGFSIENTY
jgi:hypothetical protein